MAMTYRFCPAYDDGACNIHICNCSDLEMGLYCLDAILEKHLDMYGCNDQGARNANSYLLRDAIEQAYKTYPTENAAWYELTRDD